MRLFLAALFVYVATVAFANVVGMLAPPALAQTAIRPDQICPGGACATPDITWGPGGTPPGYQIGSTVPWRTNATASPPAIVAGDLGRVVELTFPGTISQSLPTASGSFGDGAGFTIQVAAGTLTLTPTGGAKINGLATAITVGPYQSIGLMSKNGNWYGVLSVPQPTTQTGTTVLGDQMTWGAGGGGPVVCAEYTSFIGRTSGLDAPHKAAYQNLICDLKADASGVWATFDTLYVFATQDETTAKLNLVSANYPVVPHPTPGTSPAWAVDAGYTGGADGNTTVYLDTQFNPVTASPTPKWASNNAHMMAWLLNNTTAPAGGTSIGNYDGTNINQIVADYAGPNGADQCGIQGGAAAAINLSTGSKADWICSRTASNSLTLYKDGAVRATNTGASVGLVSRNIYILSRDDSGSPNSGSNRQTAAASLGSGLTATQAGVLHTKVCAYLTAVHGSC